MGRRVLSSNERNMGKLLGKSIAEAREKALMTQSSLATKLKVDVDALRGLEQGRYANPSFFTVMGIAHALKMSGDKLFSTIKKRFVEK